MHDIFFYKDRNGFEPVFAYLQELRNRTDKDSRIKLGKINNYIEMLSKEGTFAGLPYIKHIEGDIWELRPLKTEFSLLRGIKAVIYFYTISAKILKKLRRVKLKKLAANTKT